jgi:hypothetical protein
VELDIINLFGFSFLNAIKDNILKWNENFVQDHPSCMFGKLEQVFCKWFCCEK